jgi:hypothetical protein
MHRPIAFDWPARFGLSTMSPQAAQAVAPRMDDAPSPHESSRPTRPWLVKFDGPCSRCGTILRKGTEAIWDQSVRRMRCIECPRAR